MGSHLRLLALILGTKVFSRGDTEGVVGEDATMPIQMIEIDALLIFRRVQLFLG
jgi:hypothetical protein